jgi:FkbM family methyltransferase
MFDGVEVAVLPLAQLTSERRIQTVAFWKLDVEGYELPALQGAWPTTPAAAGDAPLDSAGHGT